MNKEILTQIKSFADAITNLETGRMYVDEVTGSGSPKKADEMARLYACQIIEDVDKLIESDGK